MGDLAKEDRDRINLMFIQKLSESLNKKNTQIHNKVHLGDVSHS